MKRSVLNFFIFFKVLEQVEMAFFLLVCIDAPLSSGYFAKMIASKRIEAEKTIVYLVPIITGTIHLFFANVISINLRKKLWGDDEGFGKVLRYLCCHFMWEKACCLKKDVNWCCWIGCLVVNVGVMTYHLLITHESRCIYAAGGLGDS